MQSSLIQTRDLRMHYLQKGAGEPVIFLHGFPETSLEWRHQIAHFSDRYACFAPDSRGHGKTDKPGVRCTRQLLAQDIINFMDAHGIEKASIVGHDWGGIIAFKLAIDWPERITRLALLDTLCTVWTPRAVHGYWFKAAPYPEELFAKDHRRIVDQFIGGGANPPLPEPPASPWKGGIAGPKRWVAPPDELDFYRAAYADPDCHRDVISFYRDALPFHVVIPDDKAAHGERFRQLGTADVAAMWHHPGGIEAHPDLQHYVDFGPEDRHKRFTKPTLQLYGTTSVFAAESTNGSPYAGQFKRYFPDLRTQAISGGHFFAEENPDDTNKVLAAFLGGKP